MSRQLAKSTGIVSAFTLLSRVLGLIRDILVAQIYGATGGVDAFYVAFKIPNFMRGLFAEGAFSQAFVPVLSEYRSKQPFEAVQMFIRHIAGSLGLVLLLITLIGMIGAPLWVRVFAPGYVPGTERFDLATTMLRVTFPYLFFIALTALSGAVLNSYRKFAVPAFTPALLNVCMITAALFFSKHFSVPVKAQAWAVCAAGILQFMFQLPFLKQAGFLSLPKLCWRDPGVRRVLRLMGPALFGASVGQISLLLNTIFASFLAVGSVTWLYYSDRLVYFPLGVFGVALATVVLPHLATHHAESSKAEFSAALDWGIRCNMLVGFPAGIALFVLSGQMITALFQYGKFSVHDVWMTKQSVMAYALGLLAFMLVKILSAGFYAQQNIRAPVRIAVAALAINMLLNAALVIPLHHAGLALAASLSSWVNVALLWYTLCHHSTYQLQPGWKLFLGQLFVSGIAMGLALHYVAGPMRNWLAWHWQARCLHLLLLAVVGLFTYSAVLGVCGLRIHHFFRTPVLKQ